jgi:hypothetical protein
MRFNSCKLFAFSRYSLWSPASGRRVLGSNVLIVHVPSVSGMGLDECNEDRRTGACPLSLILVLVSSNDFFSMQNIQNVKLTKVKVRVLGGGSGTRCVSSDQI